jgi:ATP-dependent RNA helicase DDX19/DBP5
MTGTPALSVEAPTFRPAIASAADSAAADAPPNRAPAAPNSVADPAAAGAPVAPPTTGTSASRGADVDWADDDAGGDELSLLTSAGQLSLGDTADTGRPASGGIDNEDLSRVKVLQADPTTPYHSAATFEEIGLSDALLKGVYHMKFNKPSKIQASSLPMILSADGEFKNLIAQGHNGSGKTACFVLAMLSRVDDKLPTPQALCVVPTRELARQIQEIVESIGKFTNVTSRLAVSFTDAERQAARRSRSGGPITDHIIIGTPGKVVDLLKKGELRPSTMRILVLDEADHMVSQQGMGDQTVRIKKQLPASTQVLLFSATYADDVKRLAEKVAPNSNQITIERETLSLDKIQQYYIDAKSGAGRFEVISDIYDMLQLGQTVVFVQTRKDAQALTTQLRNSNHAVSVLTGGEMSVEERDRVIDEFRQGTTRVLVTTNVLSRGVDVPAVTAVINYDLPYDLNRANVDPEVYLHRIGRTGRFGRKGIAINLVFDDASRRMVKDLETYYSHKIEAVEDVEILSERLKTLQ